MSNNIILFITFSVIIFIVISEAIAIYIIREKGRKLKEGVLLGLLPIIGQIIAAFLKPTDLFLVKEMYGRDLISKEEHDKTIEVKLKKGKS